MIPSGLLSGRAMTLKACPQDRHLTFPSLPSNFSRKRAPPQRAQGGAPVRSQKAVTLFQSTILYSVPSLGDLQVGVADLSGRSWEVVEAVGVTELGLVPDDELYATAVVAQQLSPGGKG